MKVFISQPMKDRKAADIQTEREEIKGRIREEFGEDVEFIESYFNDYNPKEGSIPIKYLSKSIEAMADADLVYFADGWQDARGCRIENAIAIEYGLDLIECYKNCRRKVIK